MGEFLVLVGIFRVDTWVAFLATTGVVLSVAYTLWLYRRVIYGKLEKVELREILDLNRREIAVFTPLVVLVLFFGVYPEPLLDVMHVSVANLIQSHEVAVNGSSAVAQVGR